MQQKQPPKSVVRDREESRDPATTAGFFFRLLEGKREEEGPIKIMEHSCGRATAPEVFI